MALSNQVRPRHRRTAAIAASLMGALLLGGAAAATSATAAVGATSAAIPAYGVTAPEGLTVDVGSCFSSIQCATVLGLAESLPAIDPTTLPDWDSALDGDYADFVTTGINGHLVVLRNDSDAAITITSPNGTGRLINQTNQTVTSFLGLGTSGNITLEAGEWVTLRPFTPSFGDIVPENPADYDNPTDYTWTFQTDKGDVEATWSGTPTGTWNTTIGDAVLTPDADACTADASSGTLSFTASFTPSEGALRWAETIRAFQASPESPGDTEVMWGPGQGLAAKIHFVPNASGIDLANADWKTPAAADEILSHLTSVTRSHPEWLTGADPSFVGSASIEVATANLPTVTAPWPNDGVPVKTAITITDLPVTWAGAAGPATLELAGESLNGFSGGSFASTEAALIPNPCTVIPPDPTPEIDIAKNDEGDDSHVVESGTHPVTVTITNNGTEALTNFTFADTTEAGNDVVWNEDDLAALDALTLEPGETFVVNGTVLVEDSTHRDNVVINATGVISGQPVDDEDPTEYVPEEPAVVTPPATPLSEPTPEARLVSTGAAVLASTGGTLSPLLGVSGIALLAGGLAIAALTKLRGRKTAKVDDSPLVD